MKLNKKLYDTWHDNVTWLKQRIEDQNKGAIIESDGEVSRRFYSGVDIYVEQSKINIYYDRVKAMSFEDKVKQIGLKVGDEIEVTVYLITNNVKGQEFKYFYKVDSINLDGYVLSNGTNIMEVGPEWFILDPKRNFKLL